MTMTPEERSERARKAAQARHAKAEAAKAKGPVANGVAGRPEPQAVAASPTNGVDHPALAAMPKPQLAPLDLPYDWDAAPIIEAEQHLARLRHEIELGSRKLQQRYGALKNADVKCCMCPTMIRPGQWVQNRAVPHPVTKLLHNIYFCSARCVSIYNQTHGPGGLPK